VGAEEPGIAVKPIERSDPDALLHGWQVELARQVAEQKNANRKTVGSDCSVGRWGWTRRASARAR